MNDPAIVDHFFRHAYGRLVAMLSRRVGLAHLDLVEDAVQSALMEAVHRWPQGPRPKEPIAWLYKVAHRRLLDEFRRRTRQWSLLDRHHHRLPQVVSPPPDAQFAAELSDDLLRLLFVCCDPNLPPESQLVVALKLLCGFSVDEIAQRLLISKANVYKRLTRARHRLQSSSFDWVDTDALGPRLPSVLCVCYLLFTEGYLSSHPEMSIRQELCDESLRLAGILARNPVVQTAELTALRALMHLQRGRLKSRRNESGQLLLLDEQDRSLWDQEDIQAGLVLLAQSAEGTVLTKYHVEAGLAAEHVLAPSFAETRWDRIVDAYLLLEKLAPSPIHRLNRALATAEWKGPDAGLSVLSQFEPPNWLESSHFWFATLADLNGRAGHSEVSERYWDRALGLAPSEAIRTALMRRRQRAAG
ncbi:MAG: sigma-70 family RNA polymerase sigma factor [Myxococcota bacterium]